MGERKPTPPARHCQSRPMDWNVCLHGWATGIVCGADECMIDDGFKPMPDVDRIRREREAADEQA